MAANVIPTLSAAKGRDLLYRFRITVEKVPRCARDDELPIDELLQRPKGAIPTPAPSTRAPPPRACNLPLPPM